MSCGQSGAGVEVTADGRCAERKGRARGGKGCRVRSSLGIRPGSSVQVRQCLGLCVRDSVAVTTGAWNRVRSDSVAVGDYRA